MHFPVCAALFASSVSKVYRDNALFWLQVVSKWQQYRTFTIIIKIARLERSPVRDSRFMDGVQTAHVIG